MIQLHLTAPQQWAPPVARGDEEALAAAPLVRYVHAPYLCNPASPDPVVRARTRAALQEQCDAAAAIGARGVVVHAGHARGGDVDAAVAAWAEVLDGWQPPVLLLVENTAGGTLPGRRVDDLARLFEGFRRHGRDLGVCLDTCHAHAAGERLEGLFERVVAAVGRVDLVHLNDSRDPAGSGRDRHERLRHGTIDPALLVEIAAVAGGAGAAIVLETPGTPEEHADELAWLRSALAGDGRRT